MFRNPVRWLFVALSILGTAFFMFMPKVAISVLSIPKEPISVLACYFVATILFFVGVAIAEHHPDKA